MQSKQRLAHATDELFFTSSPKWFQLEKWWKDPPNPMMNTPEYRISFLHHGFSYRLDLPDEIKRVRFYMALADRYDRCENFFDPHQDREEYKFTGLGYHSDGKLRWKISLAAMRSLCEGFFKKDKEGEYLSPLRLALRKELFSTVLWFFRRREVGAINNTNVHPMGSGDFFPEHYQKVVEGFARAFCEAAWHYENYAQHIDNAHICHATHVRLRRRVVQVVDLMGRLRMLDRLSSTQTLCDRDTLEKLESRLLAGTYGFPKGELPKGCALTRYGDYERRKPVNLEELCVIDVELAKVLLEVRLKLDYGKGM